MDKTVPLPSNRSFGWTFSGIFLTVGVYGLWRGGAVLSWLLLAAVVMAAVTVTRETWLTPLNRAWMSLGLLLGRVVNPLVLGVIFFGIFTPVGLVMRMWGRDAMARRFEPDLKSYWLKRDPPGPADDSYRNMF
jgi:Saxitoxin biosynthesis operon protein SxtJ